VKHTKSSSKKGEQISRGPWNDKLGVKTWWSFDLTQIDHLKSGLVRYPDGYSEPPEYPTVQYSRHPNTGLSGIRMVTFRTLFGSGYQMVRFSDAQFYNICPDFSSASLDCFIHKEIFMFV
jgi:hypothetical protein